MGVKALCRSGANAIDANLDYNDEKVPACLEIATISDLYRKISKILTCVCVVSFSSMLKVQVITPSIKKFLNFFFFRPAWILTFT